MRSVALLTVVSTLAGVVPGSQAVAAPTMVYSNSFEATTLAEEWSANYRRIEQWDAFSTFNGRYSQGWTALTLSAPTLGPASGPMGPGTFEIHRYTLIFDLYIIDSWDTLNTYGGSDRFLVSVNGATLVEWGFSNTGGTQSAPLTPSRGGVDLGFGAGAPDAIYRDVTLTFDTVPGQSLFIKFFDQNLGGVSDESWGIDNVVLWGEALRIPSPSAAIALGAGLSIALRRRRAGSP